MLEPYIGVIIIGAILFAIVMAFIFSSKFRKDVIASEGEAAVLGLINVKGVIIVLLTGIFGGIFVYLYPRGGVGGIEEPTIEQAISRLDSAATSGEIDYSLEHIENDVFEIKVGSKVLGESTIDHHVTKIKKNKEKDNLWDVLGIGEGMIGQLIIDGTWSYKDFYSKNGTDQTEDDVVDDYSIVRIKNDKLKYRTAGNSSLYFRIDSLNEKGTTKYWLSFAEKNKGTNELIWKVNDPDPQERFKILKTNNGRIENPQQFTFLTNVSWDNFYIVGVGLGDPEHDDDGKFLRRVKMMVFQGNVKHRKERIRH